MNKKWLVTGAAAIFLVSSSAGVYAGANLQEIKAFLDPSMKFKVNGQPFQPTNDKGAVMAPIIYNNSTYLPVRAISDGLGVAVEYDKSTHTVVLGEKVDGVSIAEYFGGGNGYRTKDSDLTVYNGKDYKDVFFQNSSGTRGVSFMLYPKGKYQKLYLQVAAVGKDIEELELSDAETDIKLETETVLVSEGLRTIEIDVGGVNEIFLHARVNDGGSLFVPITTSYFK